MSGSDDADLAGKEAWITDIHTHILPQRLALKIRGMFEASENGLQPGLVSNQGSCCSPAYLQSQQTPSFEHHGPFKLRYPAHYTAEVDQILADSCIAKIWVLPYAHKGEGMAKKLNQDISEICRKTFAPSKVEATAALTVHPDDGAEGVRRTTIEAISQRGCRAAKLHCSVGRYNVLDQALEPFWTIADQTHLPVVVHVGTHVSGHTGQDELDAIEKLVERFTDVPLIIAHSAAPATQRAITLAVRYANVYLDTTPIVTHCVSFPPPEHPSHALLIDLARNGKVLFGSDFPNVVVTLDEQIKHIFATFADDTWSAPETPKWWLDRAEARRAGRCVVQVLAEAAAELQRKFNVQALGDDDIRVRM